jgi:transposase-like protein
MIPKKLKRGSKHKYSADFRARICVEVMSGQLTVYEARQVYGISYTSNIYRWLKEFKQTLPAAILQVMNAEKLTPPSAKQPNDPEQKTRELEAALELAKLKITALEMMIDIAESELKIDIRKKSGTKQ